MTETIEKADLCCGINEFVVDFKALIDNAIKGDDIITKGNARLGLIGAFDLLRFLKKRYDLPIKIDFSFDFKNDDGTKITETINL